MQTTHDMMIQTREPGGEVEMPFEKPVILPRIDDQDPAKHAWADARFATDIMAEHALFFALLMPPEVANKERTGALKFAETFSGLHTRIAAAPRPTAAI